MTGRKGRTGAELLLFLSAAFGFCRAAPIESYIARIGPDDYYSSRGVRLQSVAEILQQDRANVHRFGLKDPEDQYDNYFRTVSRRRLIDAYYNRGSIDPGLASEIVNSDPLIRVEVYPGHIIVKRVSGCEGISVPDTAVSAASAYSGILSRRDDIRRDVLSRLRRFGGLEEYGYGDLEKQYGHIPMKHSIVGLYDIPPLNMPRLLAVASSSPVKHNDSHVAQVRLSFFEYMRDGHGVWHLTREDIAAEEYGSWGVAPAKREIKILKLGVGIYGVALESGYSGQGWLNQGVRILTPAGTMLTDILQLDLESSNEGTGNPPVTDWKADYHPEKGKGPFYDIVVHRHGIDKGAKIDRYTRYCFDADDLKYRLAPCQVSDVSGAVATTIHPLLRQGSDFNGTGGNLVPGLGLPAKLVRFRNLFGKPHHIIYPPSDDDSPMGQLYEWNFDGAELQVMADYYDKHHPNYESDILGMWLVSDGKKYVSALCGTNLGKDAISDVYRKVLTCFDPSKIKEFPVSIEQYPWQEEPLVLKFRDPGTGLFNIFYFRQGILRKIWQGEVDPTVAD